MTESLSIRIQRSPALSDDGRRRLAQVYTLLLEIANRSEPAGRDDGDDRASTAAGDVGRPGHGTAETVVSPGRKSQPQRQGKSTRAQELQSLDSGQGQHAPPEEGER